MTLLTSIFVTVLNMSITAACMTAVLLLLRPLLVRLPRVFGYLLWSVVLLRLLCPVSFTAAFSLLGLFTDGEQLSAPVAVLEQSVVAGIASSMQWAAPTVATTSPMLQLVAITWICGAAVMLLFYLHSLLRLHRRVAGAQSVGNRIYLCDGVDSPFVFGLFHPAIYLPTTVPQCDMQLVIRHEQMHIKRLDHVVKLAAFTALCVHWFNPLAWLSVLLLSRDMEMSCDEQVLRGVSSDERKSYSLLLLELAATDSRASVGTASFGQNDVTRRIKNVLNFKNISRRWLWVAGGLSAVLVVALVANPVASPSLSAVPNTSTPTAVDGGLAASEPDIITVRTADGVSSVLVPADISEGSAGIKVTAIGTSGLGTIDMKLITFIWPLSDKGYLSAGFDSYQGHKGVDIVAVKGTEIVAAQDGYVEFAIDDTQGETTYGKHVIINHGGGYRTRYAHCSELLVKSGDEVKQGQAIAKVGSTGNATGSHCHFEIMYYQDDVPNEENIEENFLNPVDYIGSAPPAKVVTDAS